MLHVNKGTFYAMLEHKHFMLFQQEQQKHCITKYNLETQQYKSYLVLNLAHKYKLIIAALVFLLVSLFHICMADAISLHNFMLHITIGLKYVCGISFR